MRKLTLFSFFIFVVQVSLAQGVYNNPNNGFQIQLNQGFILSSDSKVITLPNFTLNEPYNQYLVVNTPSIINFSGFSIDVKSVTFNIDSLPDGIESNCINSVCEITLGQWNDIQFMGTPTSPGNFDLTYKIKYLVTLGGFEQPVIIDNTELPLIRFQQTPILGCTDSNACNYDAQANTDDGTCYDKLSATVTNYSFEHQKVKVTSDSQGVNLTYKWYKGTNRLMESGDEFVPIQNGEYSVVVTDPAMIASCSSDTVDFSVTKLNRDEIETMQIALYPNPSEDRLHLVTGDSHNVLNIELVDMVGHVLSKRVLRNVSNNQTIQFDVNHLSPGLYFVKVSTDKDVISTPWMKE